MNEASLAGEVTLALVTRNQARYLRTFLDAWLRHGSGVPLLVIDDESGDDTAAMLASVPAGKPLQAHRIPHVSIAHARNEALRRATTPWVAFSDTDCLLDATYFARLPGIPARFPGAPAIEGAIHPPAGPRPPFTHGVANRNGGFFATANMVFHVPTALSLGGFDEASFGNYREDTDLALSLMERKGAIPFCPELVVIHPYVKRGLIHSLSSALTTQSLIVEAEIRLFEKHPRTYARVRHRRDARATLFSWCLKHGLSAAKASLGYLRASGPRLGERLLGIFFALEELTAAVVEQAAILAACALRLGRISKLR